MFFFKKKKEESDAPNQESMEDDLTTPQAAPVAAAKPGEASFAADVAKLKAEVEAFSDVRKATNERLSRLSEQVGELRAMIADRDRTINQIELKATKASDLVEAVHPDQQMVEIKKEDAKIEALKASIEGNELLLKRVLDELKTMRSQVSAFRGVEELVKMNNDVKGEIIDIKKVEANIEKHADKVETIFGEVQKRFIDIGKIDDSIAANAKQIADLAKNLDAVKIKAESAAPKKSVDELQAKFSEIKVQLNDVITVLNRRFSELESNNRKELEQFEGVLERKFNVTKQSLNEAVSTLKSINPEDVVKKTPLVSPQINQPNNSYPEAKPPENEASAQDSTALPEVSGVAGEESNLDLKPASKHSSKLVQREKKEFKKKHAPLKNSKKSADEEIREAAKYVEALKRKSGKSR